MLSSQIHETRIRKVTAKDKGDGIVRETVPGIDALITDEKGIPLYTSYADCVPLLFYDPEHHVAGICLLYTSTVARFLKNAGIEK